MTSSLHSKTCENSATMIDVSQDIHSLTAFKRNTSGLMKRLKRTRRPLVLTVKGKGIETIRPHAR